VSAAPTDIVVASGNPHKVQEIRAIFAGAGLADAVRLLSLAEAGGPFAEPEETGRTFQDNARLKAVAYAALTGRVALADDSGLVVDALGGEPGVDSAIWAGRDGDRATRDRRNNLKLIAAMRGVPPGARAARFVCAMCVASPDGRILAQARGACEGSIVTEPRGAAGFGYDPHFLVAGMDATSAELSPAQKNAVSHRGAASRRIAQELRLALAAPSP
jgi:XTP/dITP diphosphohydrolase